MDEKEKRKEYDKEYRKKNKETIYKKNKERYQNNIEQILEKKKEYYEKNKEQILENTKEYYEKNKDQILVYHKEYYEINKDKDKEKRKEHYETNKEKIIEKQKEWYENNKDKLKCEHEIRKCQCIICSPQIVCKNCQNMIMSANKIYQPYCFICYCVVNPDIEIKRRYKTKENLLAEALKEMNLGVDFIQDKKIQEGCSKRRPDFFFELFTHTVIIECDEYCHKDYDTNCEIAKLNDTFTDLADRPMILIRFNPDKYDGKSCFDKDAKLIKNEWNRRIKVLKKEIKSSIKEIPKELITIKKLFFE